MHLYIEYDFKYVDTKTNEIVLFEFEINYSNDYAWLSLFFDGNH